MKAISIGHVVDDLRKAKGLKQKDLADMLGITQSYMSNLLSGKKEWMLELLIKVCNIVEIPVSEVFRMIEIEPKRIVGLNYDENTILERLEDISSQVTKLILEIKSKK